MAPSIDSNAASLPAEANLGAANAGLGGTIQRLSGLKAGGPTPAPGSQAQPDTADTAATRGGTAAPSPGQNGMVTSAVNFVLGSRGAANSLNDQQQALAQQSNSPGLDAAGKRNIQAEMNSLGDKQSANTASAVSTLQQFGLSQADAAKTTQDVFAAHTDQQARDIATSAISKGLGASTPAQAASTQAGAAVANNPGGMGQTALAPEQNTGQVLNLLHG